MVVQGLKMQNKNNSFKSRVASRKFFLMISILFLGFIAMGMPAISLLFPYVKLAPMMTGGEFVSLILGSFAIYCGANVFQKKTEIDKGSSEGSSDT